MKIRGKEVNPWKFIVVAWSVHKFIKLARAFLKAKRLVKKTIKKELINKYDDLWSLLDDIDKTLDIAAQFCFFLDGQVIRLDLLFL